MNKYLSLSAVLLCSVFSVQAQTSRLVAVTRSSINASGTRTILDTSNIIYNPGNTHTGTPQQFHAVLLKADTVITEKYSSNSPYPYRRVVTGFDAAGRPVHKYMYGTATLLQRHQLFGYAATGMADTTRTWSYNQSLGATVNIYSGGKLAEIRHEDSIGNLTHRQLYTYGPHGIEKVEVVDNKPIPDTMQRTTTVYTAAGLVDSVTDMLVSLTGNVTRLQAFAYNAAGKPVSSSWFYNEAGNGYIPYSYNGYRYDAAGTLADDTVHNDFTMSGNLVPVSIMRYTYNSAGLNDTLHNMPWDAATSSFHYNTCDVMTYTADSQLSSKGTYMLNQATGHYEPVSFMDFHHYYYASTTSVAAAAQKVIDMRLYPNPAGSILQVRIAAIGTQPYTMAITNAMGRLQRTWQPQLGQQVHTIPISDLQAGTYILTISNGAERQSQQFVVAR